MNKRISKISLLFFLLLFCTRTFSQQKDQVNEITDSVKWKTSISEALTEAKRINKLLFVYCFSPTCPHCQAVSPFFETKEIANKYNHDFISYKLNLSEEEDVKFLTERNITLPSWPRLLFFDRDGNLVHESAGEPFTEDLINTANIALNPLVRAGSFEKRFEEGELSIDFLANYAMFAKVKEDTATQLKVSNVLFSIYPKDRLGSIESWKLTKDCVSDLDNGFAKYWLNHVEEAKQFEINAGSPGNEGNTFRGIIQNSLFGSKGKFYSFAKLGDVRKYIDNIGASEYADNLLWEFETKALIKENKLEHALAIGKKMINTFKGNGSAYVYITRVFTDNFPDNSYVKSAKTWLVSALPTITQDNVRAEYYYELARLNQKDGESEKAKLNAKTAVDLATKIGTKLEKFNTLYESIK
ncbi:TlpA family protein disulfide reductase [Arcticibacterium luteifluviistationis]|uniref:Thioredoxin domain-containing protein n=1 Tax=Arcticibacterium luteifluviistationis TaxID=1784714 RepID=A0A2Z4GGK2_9BACT|nr:thioredoxin family protein [Arcticibacterium luteifluviistationis]AWW00135.1 hypothetical protein DJ013_18965 [Arcticibacterium luteifluviistationis]